MQMIFAFLFLLGLNPVFSQTAAATVVGNNWDATKHCFLQTGKTDCLSLFREGGCQADYCGKDEIYGYGTYQLPAFQVPKTTKCIVAKDCDETQMTLNFGNIDRYKNYWCMEQACLYGRIWAVIDGTTTGCLRPNPTDATKPCFEGTQENVTIDGNTVPICTMTEAQFWTAWNRTKPPDCKLIYYWSGGECTDDCTGPDKYRHRVWGGGGNYLYKCAEDPVNDYIQFSYIRRQYLHSYEKYEIVKQTYPVQDCKADDGCTILYVKNSAGTIIYGRELSHTPLPTGITCPSVKTSVLDSVNVKFCTLTATEVEKYYGKSTDNCKYKMFDELGPCDVCPDDKPYRIDVFDTNFWSNTSDYGYDCANKPPADDYMTCVVFNAFFFPDGAYKGAKRVCFDIRVPPPAGLSTAIPFRVGTGDSFIGNWLSAEPCPDGKAKNYTNPNVAALQYEVCEMESKDAVDSVIFGTRGCAPLINTTESPCIFCQGDKMLYITQYLNSEGSTSPGYFMCIDECLEDAYHHQAWNFNWGKVCYHMLCDKDYTYVLVGDKGNPTSGGCVKSGCFKCPEGGLSGSTPAEFIKHTTVTKKAAASNVCVITQATFDILGLKYKKREKSSPEIDAAIIVRTDKAVTIVAAFILLALTY